MGQQQLILLVLAVVIVGLAIVVGIRAFTENSQRSNSDAMIQDAVRIANDIQAWKQKPAPFGGQGSVATQAQVIDPNDFAGANFPLLGYTNIVTPLQYQNLNGTFEIDVASGDSTSIEAINTQHNNKIRVDLTGLTDLDVRGTVVCLGGKDATGAACTAAF